MLIDYSVNTTQSTRAIQALCAIVIKSYQIVSTTREAMPNSLTDCQRFFILGGLEGPQSLQVNSYRPADLRSANIAETFAVRSTRAGEPFVALPQTLPIVAKKLLGFHAASLLALWAVRSLTVNVLRHKALGRCPKPRQGPAPAPFTASVEVLCH